MGNIRESPSVKKRVASRQLSAEDSESSDSDESPRFTSGSFPRASEQVLASRRIIRVRRSGAAASAASNPFSGISLVAPVSSQKAQILSSSSACSDANWPRGSETKSLVAATGGEKSSDEAARLATEKEATGGSAGSGISQTPHHVCDASEASLGQPEVRTTTSSGFASFSSTGWNAPTSFASVGAAFPSSTSCGLSGVGALVSSESHSFTPVFGRSGLSAGTDPDSSVCLQEVQVETGEEGEATVFAADATLFEYINEAWKERGKGELKLNVSRDKSARKPRLVMRSSRGYRLLLNASLFPDMKVSKLDTKGVIFACANSVAKGKTRLAMYGVKMKDGSVAAQFSSALGSHKGIATCN